MRADKLVALLAAALAAASGCSTRSCKEHTLLVTVEVDGAAASAAALGLAVSVGSGSAVESRVMLGGHKHGTIEITFPHGYPSGQRVTVSVAALDSNNATLATVDGAITLDKSCGALALDFARAGGGDLGTPDACVPATLCSAADSCGQISDGCGGQITCGAGCVVNAVYPPMGATGDVISLEGRFGASATVHFPGGATAPATVLGPTRLTVVVPATAGSGLLTVASNGTTTNAFSFTHAAYAVAPQTFRGAYEQADYARQTATLGTQRWGAGGVTMPDRVWLIGGEDKSEAPLGSVEEARIDGDGALRSFTTLTSALVTKRGWGTAVRTGSWVYAIGGRNAQLNAEPTIERAPINADGSLGAFAAVDIKLGKPRFGHQSLVIGGYVYVLGGYTGAWCAPAPQLATVERAPIGADGTLGAFEDAGVTLTTARVGFGVAVGGGYLYAVGGDRFISDMMAADSSVDYAPIAADGTLGAFKSAGGILPYGGSGAGAIVLGGKLWKMGDGIYSAAVHADGTLDNFTTVFKDGHTSFGYGTLIGDYYYMLGNGFGDCSCSACYTGYFGSTERVLVGSGAIGAFASPPASTLTVARSHFGLAVAGNHVYAIGGNMSGADVEMATIGADGNLGDFAPVAGLALGTPRLRTTTAVVGNNVYVVGGVSQASANLATVEVAAIQPDDTLGSFTAATATLHTAGLRVLAVYGSALCAFGGAVECAPINSDGTLGAFAAATIAATTPPTPVNGGGGDLALLTGGIYGIGGTSPMSLAAVDDFGAFTSSFVSYGSYAFIAAPGSATVLGSSLYVLGGNTGLDAASSVSHIAIDPATSKPAAQTAGAAMQFKHDAEGLVLIHGRLHVIGGTNGGMPEIAPLQ